MENVNIRMATPTDEPAIWELLQQAIQRRKAAGSTQWQDGYPNPTVVQNDIQKSQGFVLTIHNVIAAYVAIIINDEPAYDGIEGTWLSNSNFVVLHRIAVADDFIGKGYASQLLQWAEQWAMEKQIWSIKADTKYDNKGMLHLFEKLEYQYCGEVFFRGGARMAFEKLLK